MNAKDKFESFKGNLGQLAFMNFMKNEGNSYINEKNDILEEFKLDIIDAVTTGSKIPVLENAEWIIKCAKTEPFNTLIYQPFSRWCKDNFLRMYFTDNTMFSGGSTLAVTYEYNVADEYAASLSPEIREQTDEQQIDNVMSYLEMFINSGKTL